MKRILSLVIVACLLVSTIVLANDIESNFKVNIKGSTVYSSEDIKLENINSLSSVAKAVIDTVYSSYSVHTYDEHTKIYVAEGALKEVGINDRITAKEIFIHTKEPGKISLHFTAYNNNNLAVDGYDVELECIAGDDRRNVELESITVGGKEIDDFNKGIYKYTVEIADVSVDTTVGYKSHPDDTVETISKGSKTYLVVFNKDKTNRAIYEIDFIYSNIDDINVEIAETAESGNILKYKCTSNNVDITSITDVKLDETKAFLENTGEIHLVDSGSLNVEFTAGNAKVTKAVNVTGDKVYDSPQYSLTIGDLTKAYTGEVYTVKYSSDVFKNDTRISVTSTNNNVIRVIGNKLFVLSAGTTYIEVSHPLLGRLFNREIDVMRNKDSSYDLLPEIDSINMKVNECKEVDFKLKDKYMRNVKIEVATGSSVKVLGGRLLGLKLGKSTIKITSGKAEKVVDVNVVAPDVIIPTDIDIKNLSSEFVKDKESIFEVTTVPDGATLAVSDIAVTSDKKVKVVHKDGLQYYITPLESGNHTIKVSASKYSMEKSILVEAKDSGEVVHPDIPGVNIGVEKIVLEDTYISLEVGDTKTIKVKNITPASATNKKVRYESTNKYYATVDANGVVSGERAGTVRINVYSVSNPEVYATCTVNVYDEDSGYGNSGDYKYPVDKVVIYREDNGKEVAIRNDRTEVMVNTEQQFVARIYPYNATNQEVRWYTSDANIAEVDEDGVLTAYRVGEVELRVVTRDGNHRDSIKVEITKWMLKPTSLKIVNVDNSEVKTDVKTGDKISLKVEFEPLLTTERDVIWTVTEGYNLFTLSKTGDVEFKEVGKATIKVYTKDYSNYATLTFNITYSEDYWKDIGSVKNMSPRKAIEVRFSEALSINNIQNGTIFVATTKDGNTKAENVVMELVDNNKVLRVSNLNGEWDPEKTYYLLISGKSKSARGIDLIKNCRYTFETRKGRQSAK